MKRFITLACIAFLTIFIIVGCMTTQQSIQDITVELVPKEEKQLAVTDLVFCLFPPEDLGLYVERTDSNYGVGEVIILYVGFRGITSNPLENGLIEAWLIEYITIVDPDGTEKYNMELINAHITILPEDFPIDPSWFWNTIPITPDFVAGEHAIRVEIIDNLNGNTDTKEIKFTVIE